VFDFTARTSAEEAGVFQSVNNGIFVENTSLNALTAENFIFNTSLEDLTLSIQGAEDGETLFSGLGNDSLTGSSDADNLISGSGNDTLNGLGGEDTLIGESGDDTLIGDGTPALSLDSVEGEVFRAWV